MDISHCSKCAIRLDKLGKSAQNRKLDGEVVCFKCFIANHKRQKANESDLSSHDVDCRSIQDQSSTSGDGRDEMMETDQSDKDHSMIAEHSRINIPSTHRAHNSCIFSCTKKRKLIYLRKNIRLKALIDFRLRIPKGNVCCSCHLD